MFSDDKGILYYNIREFYEMNAWNSLNESKVGNTIQCIGNALIESCKVKFEVKNVAYKIGIEFHFEVAKSIRQLFEDDFDVILAHNKIFEGHELQYLLLVLQKKQLSLNLKNCGLLMTITIFGIYDQCK